MSKKAKPVEAPTQAIAGALQGMPLDDLQHFTEGLYKQMLTKVAQGKGTQEDFKALNTARAAIEMPIE